MPRSSFMALRGAATVFVPKHCWSTTAWGHYHDIDASDEDKAQSD